MNRRTEKKARTRRSLQEAAFRLFLEQGYEGTTVARIAEEAGVSHMTFFRHFPTKEDVVLQDEYDPMLEELVRAQPADAPPLDRVRAAVRIGFGEVYARDRESLLRRCRLILGVPVLRARIADSMASSRTAFERGLSAPEEYDDPPLWARAVAAACTAALAVAVVRWAEDDGDTELPDLVDEVFDALSASPAPVQGKRP
ncbi:TetR/AcrR family transcriptional regulator [Thermobifida halotolerans]|uniref:TetR/AcrR family transcriptional regulator n=1 Tax=Thermobifida halotolerans TaxID=483545 RepID=UPI001F3D94D2|nr:TetR/AcrR family transcriptional regulator [Thermobifida halotolerans]